MGLTIFLIFYAGKFVINGVLPYFGFDKTTFGDYRDFKWSLIFSIFSTFFEHEYQPAIYIFS